MYFLENDNDVDGDAQVSDKRILEAASGEGDATYMEESPPVSPVELKPELPPYLPAIQGCRNVLEFDCLNRIEEGTYGVVYRARHKKTSKSSGVPKHFIDLPETLYIFFILF